MDHLDSAALALSPDPDARAVLADHWEEQGRLDVAMLYRDMLPEPTRKRRKRVNKLTDAERKKMPGWAQRWIAIGRSTQPADHPLAEAAIRACYRHSGLDDRIRWSA